MIFKNFGFRQNFKQYNESPVSTVERLQHFDTVSIEGLPKCVMMTFDSALSGATQTRHIPEADLSDVDSDLVDKLMEFQKEGVK